MPTAKTGSVFYTEDGGDHWQKIACLKQGLYATQTFFADERHGWFMAVEELWGTGDGGHTWAPKLKVDWARYGVVRDVFFMDKSTGWLVTSAGYILKCTE